MKHLVLTAALVATIAGAVGFFSFRTSSDPAVAAALARRDAMAWLRTDFQLTDAQFAAIKQLHDSYSVVCEEHCRAIQAATRARNELKARAEGDAAAFAAADRRVEELRLVCESAIATHVRQCAAEMSPPAGRRYLALVLPKIRDFDHIAAPDLHLNRHKH
ncbi:MAG TPA: periplasmic heavy metal sensor [Opitutaceae bacterium]|nr:periplasmic heavy metal sensor [Opitutaceae bacterium]